LPLLENTLLFDIMLEPEQGSLIDHPTGSMLFVGRAVSVIQGN
jgi:anti-sigma-K factor RskA